MGIATEESYGVTVVLDKEQIIEQVEYQVAVFIRRAILSNRRSSVLERSAYLLLRHLHEQGPMGVKNLAGEFHLDVSTVSRQAATLESRGDLERLPDPYDRRASSFRITEAGEQKLVQEKRQRAELYEALLKDWSPEDSQRFADLLTRLNQTFLD